MIDVTMFENVYMKYGSYIFGPQSGPLIVMGRLQRRGEGVSVIAEKIDSGITLPIHGNSEI